VTYDLVSSFVAIFLYFLRKVSVFYFFVDLVFLVSGSTSCFSFLNLLPNVGGIKKFNSLVYVSKFIDHTSHATHDCYVQILLDAKSSKSREV